MEQSIITEKFEAWTKGLNPVESRIVLFEKIRNIPYLYVPELMDPVKGPAGLLEQNKGTCSPKHYLLAEYFKQLSIPIQYCTYIFSWKDSLSKGPSELKTLAEQLPKKMPHFSLKAYLNNQWVVIDATWDPPLNKAGFPVNANWDGFSSTQIAVAPLEETDHDTLEERIQYQNNLVKDYTQKELQDFQKFAKGLNIWLDQLRKTGSHTSK